ncbi:D-tyrosyl-tRNA(Tyr) deacylase [Anoxybacter fermentans]|uniref:D-aminoacyl-tRNA deacylase n=1 Tax=Anoxybacter fermentans TaxID=1323375 RepID=A0A3Q9HQ73_9FIRM|nr:D-aminoacyl-tRNA deacylase [Anoxybacter fermentans]AZR73090.1 D-tyrosyl-tRNA(Tyr) deacylase [Anoxybacter fermentans]
MRAVVQRVLRGSVTVEGKVVGKIGPGLVILLGIGQDDGPEDIKYLAEKIVNLRIFEDENGKMNLSALDKGLELLVISQFTLYGDCRKGRRPSFTQAASPKDAEALYKQFVEEISKYGLKVETGQFQAMMDVELVNTGPVTMLLDSKRIF